MSNTASLRRTELGAHIARSFPQARVATIIAGVLLAMVLITFRPFGVDGMSVPEGGDTVNQLGFGALGALALFALAAFADRRVLAALASPWWLLLAGFVALSVMNATDVPSAIRAASFTAIGFLIVAAVLTVPRGADGFSAVLLFSGFLVVGLCYLGLVLLPGAATHGVDALEPQHEGFWRGLFSHKNIAGPVMACFSFAGLYVWRRDRGLAGLALLVLAMVFMANTGSKTTAGLVPLAIVMVMAPGLFGLRFLTAFLFVGAVTGTALFTIGMALFDPVRDLLQSISPGLTYTGRLAIWEFAIEMVARRPWTGYGFESFWTTGIVRGTDQPFDRAWDVRGIVHGHNGYLDIAVTMGIPALLAALVAFIVAPMRDYLRTPLRRENVLIADLFMMMMLFTALNACLESFFFRRVDPVWLFFMMGALGLRLAARFPIRA